MEKLIYSVWRNPAQPWGDFDRDLLAVKPAALFEQGARGLQVNLRDDRIEKAMGNLFPGVTAKPSPPDAVVHLWVDSAINAFRAPYDARIVAGGHRIAAYLVTESQPAVNVRAPATAGERMPGFSQLAFLQRPPRLTHEEWLRVWFDHHTHNAVKYHDCLSYVQNIVVRPVTADAPPLDALVEECFVIEAVENPLALFSLGGDPSRYPEYREALMKSAAMMVDFDKVDVLQTGSHHWPVRAHWPT